MFRGFPQQTPRLYDSSLIGWWPLTEATGTKAFNNGRYNLDGELYGTLSWDSDTLGRCVKLNGTGFVRIYDNNWIYKTNGTVSFWYKTSNGGSGYCGIFTRQWTWGIYSQDNWLIYYNWSGPGGNPTIRTDDNKWHHVSLTIQNGVSNGSQMFYDGNVVVTGIHNFADGYYVCIGSGGGADGTSYQCFSGKIADCRIYNRLLSNAEVKELYNLGPNPNKLIIPEPTYGFPKKGFGGFY